MSNIYLSGVKLPKDELGAFEVIVMYRSVDGKIRAECHGTHEVFVVPEHGRLGDLDALHKLFLEKAKEYKGVGGAMVAMAALCIANAPTIIEADGKA